MADKEFTKKSRRPAPKRQIDWFPAPPPPPPLPEHLLPNVQVIDEEEEIVVPKVVEKAKEDLNPPKEVWVPNLTLATRDPHWVPPTELYSSKEKYELLDIPF